MKIIKPYTSIDYDKQTSKIKCYTIVNKNLNKISTQKLYIMKSFLSNLIFNILLISNCFSQQSQNVFTLVEIPSSYDDSTILSQQIQWIIDNVETKHIDFVIHAGDLVPFKYIEQDWIRSSSTIHRLDNFVPYFVLTGNHEIFYGEGPNRERNYELFKKYFPISYAQKYSCFVDNYPGSMDNAYFVFKKSNILLLCLEFAPRDEILNWANQIILEHQDLSVVITTHCYTRSANPVNNQSWGPAYLNGNNNDREAMWEKLIKNHKNISIVLSYHFRGIRRETSLGENGNQIHQILTNYLDDNVHDNGWIRIINFYPKMGKVKFFTYSPIKNEFLSDQDNQFELTYK